MKHKILLVDRDGTLIEEPADGRVDALDKVRLMPGVIPALLQMQAAGYRLVIVSNQEGLGDDDFPRSAFDAAERHVQALFASQGIRFDAAFYCPHYAEAACSCRKPGIGLLTEMLARTDLDRAASAVVGDRETDMQLAANLGLRGFLVSADGPREQQWPAIAHALLDRPRTASVQRTTRETDIEIDIDLDETADAEIETGLGFFDHMLEQLGKHGGFRLRLRCRGDLDIDEHHTVEDCALGLGEALKAALGDKRGIHRYGFVLPMDEAEARVSIDLGGRPYLVFDGEFPREHVGQLPTELVPHFFRSLSEALGAAIHISVRGENAHHMVEACFKGVARSLRQAIALSGTELPTTKGLL